MKLSDSLVGRIIAFPNGKTVAVKEKIGCGATCNVYTCESDGETVLLKEYCPDKFREEIMYVNSKGYTMRVLSAAKVELFKDFTAYIKKMQSIRTMLLKLCKNNKSLKKYVVIPPELECSEDAIIVLDEDKEVFCGLMLLPYDSLDFSKEISKYNLIERLDVLIYLCKIVDYFHKNHYLLKDLKPQNMLFQSDDFGGFSLKLFDFDSVLELKDDFFIKTKDRALISSSIFFGAPEGKSKDKDGKDRNIIPSCIGVAADLFSMGAMLLYFVMFESFLDGSLNKQDIDISIETHGFGDIISAERLYKLLIDNSKKVTIGFCERFERIILQTMSMNHNKRLILPKRMGISPMQHLEKELEILKEILQSQGVHPEVMRDKAMERFKEFNIDTNMLTDIE